MAEEGNMNEVFYNEFIFGLLCGAGLAIGLSLIAKALIDWILDIRDARKRNVRPFDGWKGGRL
jgi:hypothetical protein